MQGEQGETAAVGGGETAAAGGDETAAEEEGETAAAEGGETAAAGKVTFHSNLPIYFVIERDSIVYKEDRPADAIDVSEEIMKNYGQNKYPAIKNSKVISIIDIYGLIDIIEIIMDIIIDFTKSTQPDQSA